MTYPYSGGEILNASDLNDFTTNSVGIGITSPDEPLHIVTGSGDAFVKQENGTTTTLSGPDSANTGLYGTSSNHDTRFITNNTERVRIDTSGKVGIGDTNPNSQLEVVSTDERAFRFDRVEDVASTNVTCGIMQIGTDSTNPGTDDYWILFRKGNASTVGSVRGTGSASVNFSTTSDATLKTDQGIATADRIGTIIDGLQVHQFDWNEGDVTDQIGLFAQEAIDVLPESIVNAPTTMPSDQEGADDEYVPAGLDYSKIVPILIAECQFLRQRVAALEA
jgi:hypothetical protein